MRATQPFPWREMPMLRPLFAYLLGVAGACWWGAPRWPLAATMSLCIGLLPLMIWWSGPRQLGQRSWVGAGLLIAFVALGAWRTGEVNQSAWPDHFSRLAAPGDTLNLRLRLRDVTPTGERWRLEGEAEAVVLDSLTAQPCRGRLLLYLGEWSGDLPPPGGKVLARVAPAPLEPPRNPYAFDYAAYQARRQVYHRAFVTGRDIKPLPPVGWSLPGTAERCRERLLRILRTHLPAGSHELAVASALILGQRDDLSRELRDAYADTGAVHVLAVSGLHVGFIAAGLQALLGFGRLGRRRWRWLRLGLTLSGVWAFALITGLSPSVQRAATMFSFLLVGRALDRKAGIYNALAASALCLCLVRPLLLFDVGFQLSYLAVGGIVFFQPLIYRAWFPPNRLLDYCWKLTAVALAAQLTTFPLSLFYFHQFPVYFWLTGVVVVTAASFILGLGILLFALHAVPWLGLGLGFALRAVVWLVNAFIFAVQSLPHGVLDGIWIGGLVLLGLYLGILGFGYWVKRRGAMSLAFTLGCLLLAGGTQSWRAWQNSGDRSLTIYHLSRESALDYFDGLRRYSWSSVDPESEQLAWAAAQHRLYRGSRSVTHLTDLAEDQASAAWWRPPFLALPGLKMAIVDPSLSLPEKPPSKPLDLDLVLLRDSPWLDLADLEAYFTAKHWVFDGSNYPSRVDDWLAACDSLGLHGHATYHHGAFQFNPDR